MKKALIGISATIFSGAILLAIEYSFFVDDEKVESTMQLSDVEKADQVMINSAPEKDPTSSKLDNNYYIQTGRTYNFFDDRLSLTLAVWLEYSNSEIELKVSSPGEPVHVFKDISIGEKVFFEKFEITFVETRKNITTYDVTLKIIEI